MANTGASVANRPEIWEKELYKDVSDNLFFTQGNMMGPGTNNIIQVKDQLTKERGDTITVPLTTKLSGNGVDGDEELEGNEEEITDFSDQVLIDQKRFGVRLKGNLEEKKAAFNLRMDAKEKLAIRMQEWFEMQFFLKAGGVANTTITDVNGDTVGLGATWGNTADTVPAADSAAGTGDRYLCANTGGADALTAADKITPQLISKLKAKAKTANPKIVPLMVNGRKHFVMFIHPWQAFDLKQNPIFHQAMREAEVRGKDNPIFSGAIGVWDGVIIHEHEYVPFLDVSVAGNNFGAAASGTDFAVDTFRAIFCGRQSLVYARCNNPNRWVEKDFDYKNKTGFAHAFLGGIQKVTFNSKDYGVMVLDTAATSLA